MTRLRLLLGAALLSLLLTVVAGCGGTSSTAADPAESTDPSPSATDTAPAPTDSASPTVTTPVTMDTPSTSPTSHPEWPSCTSVWQSGQRLPQGYDGCRSAGQDVPAAGQPCSFGKKLYTFDKRFYAVAGGPVNQTDGLASDQTYQQALKSCTG